MASDLHLAQYDLPALMCRDIGRIITRSAYMQNYIQKIVYMLAGVTEEVGRLAIRDPRTSDRIDLILDLIAVRGLPDPSIDIKHLIEIMAALFALSVEGHAMAAVR